MKSKAVLRNHLSGLDSRMVNTLVFPLRFEGLLSGLFSLDALVFFFFFLLYLLYFD